MLDTFLGGLAAWFTVPAVMGTLYFLIQLFMMQAAGDLDFDVDTDGVHGHDGGGEVRLISLQSISAFFMGAGWMGLAAYRMLDLSFGVSSLFAILGGAVSGWIIVTTSKLVLKLQSSGNIELADTTGLAGSVCVQVPGAGQGQGRVKLVVQNRLREYDAVQDGEEPLPSGTRVTVFEVDAAANTLRVRSIDE